MEQGAAMGLYHPLDVDRMYVVGRTHLRRCIEFALHQIEPDLLVAVFNLLCCPDNQAAVVADGDAYLLPPIRAAPVPANIQTSWIDN